MVPAIDKYNSRQSFSIQSRSPVKGDKIFISTRSGKTYGILSRSPTIGSIVPLFGGMKPKTVIGGVDEVAPSCLIDLARFAMVYGSTTESPSSYTGTIYYGNEVNYLQCGRSYNGYFTILFILAGATLPVAAIELRICKNNPKILIIDTYGEVAASTSFSLWFDKGSGSSDWVSLNTVSSGSTLSHVTSTYTFVETHEEGSITIACCETCEICACKPCNVTSRFYAVKEGTSTQIAGTKLTYGLNNLGENSIVWNIADVGTYNVYFIDGSDIAQLIGTLTWDPYSATQYEIVAEYKQECTTITTWTYTLTIPYSEPLPVSSNYPYIKKCVSFSAISSCGGTLTPTTSIAQYVPALRRCNVVGKTVSAYGPNCYFTFTAVVREITDTGVIRVDQSTVAGAPSSPTTYYGVTSGVTEGTTPSSVKVGLAMYNRDGGAYREIVYISGTFTAKLWFKQLVGGVWSDWIEYDGSPDPSGGALNLTFDRYNYINLEFITVCEVTNMSSLVYSLYGYALTYTFTTTLASGNRTYSRKYKLEVSVSGLTMTYCDGSALKTGDRTIFNNGGTDLVNTFNVTFLD